MKNRLYFLVFLSAVLGSAILWQNFLPSFLSFQNPVNPSTLTEIFDSNAKIAYFDNQKISPNLKPPQNSPVLGDETPSNKRIEVDLTTQTLTAYQDNQLIFQFLISSGKWDRTPNGTFSIWTKIRSQKMSGGSKELGTYYYLPNVPYIMFFYNDKYTKQMGFSLHGTYWHNNFGTPMSHGCINMKTSEVAQLYDWAEVGTPIIIYGKFIAKK
jgi:lipoprotein-anchoring transpeptidase ErfK/SrfK